jgi:hypothetical protein
LTACSNGHCGVTCNNGYTACNSATAPYVACVNTTNDPQNCGTCGKVCATSQACQGGTCQSCAAGQILCNGKCVNPQTDGNNCGGCGNACYSYVLYGAPTGCSNGQCGVTCNIGYTACTSTSSPSRLTCVNTVSDPQNCGACGNVCGAGQIWHAGMCQS